MPLVLAMIMLVVIGMMKASHQGSLDQIDKNLAEKEKRNDDFRKKYMYDSKAAGDDSIFYKLQEPKRYPELWEEYEKAKSEMPYFSLLWYIKPIDIILANRGKLYYGGGSGFAAMIIEKYDEPTHRKYLERARAHYDYVKWIQRRLEENGTYLTLVYRKDLDSYVFVGSPAYYDGLYRYETQVFHIGGSFDDLRRDIENNSYFKESSFWKAEERKAILHKFLGKYFADQSLVDELEASLSDKELLNAILSVIPDFEGHRYFKKKKKMVPYALNLMLAYRGKLYPRMFVYNVCDRYVCDNLKHHRAYYEYMKAIQNALAKNDVCLSLVYAIPSLNLKQDGRYHLVASKNHLKYLASQYSYIFYTEDSFEKFYDNLANGRYIQQKTENL